ncbi:MAG: muropeptide transporter AmpG [Betaproteobacteria bacterium RIFCSPLOWO2_12_FULL_66_14]|nr:MAG: muropeptide transporter AmpG [Betaproteobacteria bacterium RIFCSPLOWO2_12_FULL_66_14]
MALADYAAAFRSRKIALLLVLGFASGLPLALTAGTLQAWLAADNVDIVAIGWFALVGQPYTYKFLWAPLMDRYAPPFLGRRRGWLLVTQLALAAAIGFMGTLTPANSAWLLGAAALTVALLSASQDIVFDALRTDWLEPEERGAGAAVSVLGYRIAMLVSGAGALILADQWLGWQATYWLMAALMGVGMAATWLAVEPEPGGEAPRTLDAAVVKPFAEFFTRQGAVAILLLVVLYKLGDAFAGNLTTTFLLRGPGFSLTEVGAINKGFGLAATIVGALAGGALMAKMRLYRALLLFGVLQAITNLGFMLLAASGKSYALMVAVIGLENLCGGMGTAAYVALLMALCDRRFSATQYALLSALSAVGRVYVGPVAGYLVAGFGWQPFFFFSFLIALPGLALLVWMRARIDALDDGSAPAR